MSGNIEQSVDAQKFDRNDLGQKLVAKYDADKKKNRSFFRKIFRIRNLLILLIVITSLYFLWDYLIEKFDLFAPKEIIIIRPDDKPHRIKPDDPGGLIIANRDKSVYETIAKSNSAKEQKLPTVTRVMPPPEMPVNRKEVFEDDDSDLTIAQKQKNDLIDKILNEPIVAQETQVQLDLEQVLKDSKSEDEIKENIAESLNVDIENFVKKEQAKEIYQAPVEVVKKDTRIKILTKPTKPFDIPTLTQPSYKPTKYQVQLGAYKSISDANKDKVRLQNRHTELLQKQEFIVEKADLRDKGIFYRLKITSFKNERSARKLCDDLRVKKQDCLFIKN